MFINETPTDKTIRQVHGITPLEKSLICAYLQGCVYSWCKNKMEMAEDGTMQSSWFKVQYFLGEKNYYWQGTPVYCLYAKRLRQYKGDSEKACKLAARDAGNILKELLRKDKRSYYTELDERSYRWYRWDGQDDEDIIDTHPDYPNYAIKAKSLFESKVDSFI